MQTIKELFQLILDNEYEVKIHTVRNALEVSFKKDVSMVHIGESVIIQKDFFKTDEMVGEIIELLSKRLLEREQYELKRQFTA